MMTDAMAQGPIRLSWDAKSLLCQTASEVMFAYDCEAQDFSCLPKLESQSVALDHVYLPMDRFVVRAVSLPLKSPHLVDADMLFQEIADTIDLDAEQWWLSWRLSVCDDGVAGMVFAMPESLRLAMQEDVQWNHAKYVLVDGYERLQAHIDGQHACAVIDQDSDGLFMGFYDGQAWRGMRRLNGGIAAQTISQMMRSWQSMGFDAEKDQLVGRANDGVLNELKQLCAHCDVAELFENKSRNEANLALDMIPSLNLRHGRWSAHSSWVGWKQWKRSFTLCALILLAWFIVTGLDLSSLDRQLEFDQQRIEQAFHQGLPNETVMLDAMAQLRQAAGGNAAHESVFLQSLQVVSQVYAKRPWQLKLLELRDGNMQMSGTIKDIESLNKMQALLQQKMAKDVKIVDTNIAGKKVSFRMSW